MPSVVVSLGTGRQREWGALWQEHVEKAGRTYRERVVMCICICVCVSVCACACGVDVEGERARRLCKWVYRGMFWNCVLVAEGESLPRKAQFRPIPPPVSWQPYHLEVAGRPSCYGNGGFEWQLQASRGQEPWQVLY